MFAMMAFIMIKIKCSAIIVFLNSEVLAVCVRTPDAFNAAVDFSIRGLCVYLVHRLWTQIVKLVM